MKIKVAIAVMTAMAAVGCTVGPDYERPRMEMPSDWSVADAAEAVDTTALTQWWTTLDDALLSQLIDRAEADSPDLAGALARIEQSRALRAAAAGEQWPSVDAVGGYTRQRGSANGLSPFPGEHSLYNAGFDAFWELDLFGRVRRSVEAAQATLEQSIEDYRNVRLSLYAEVARNYIELRTVQRRIDFAVANIDIQQKTLQLTQDRFDADLAPELDVSQAQLILANTQSEIPSLRIAETAALNRLATLVGATPGALRDDLLVAGPLPQAHVIPTTGLPAELLRRRPDIRSAERALAAQTARIGLVEAQRYPSFSLSGSLALEATHISNMGDWSSRAFGFGPGVRWNLFDGNRLRHLAAAEEAGAKQLVAAYEATVLRAVEEVENAMIGYAQEQERTAALRQSVGAAKKSVELVETLYRNGLTNFQNVLDTQRSLSQQQDRLAVSEGATVQQAVALYKALGGGWDDTENSKHQAQHPKQNHN